MSESHEIETNNMHQSKYEQSASVSHYVTFFLKDAPVLLFKTFKCYECYNDGTLYLNND